MQRCLEWGKFAYILEGCSRLSLKLGLAHKAQGDYNRSFTT
jgi:hypothetical protein